MRLRDIIMKFMSPKMRAEAEADSRAWVATCPNCQAENSIWDIGGLRYKGSGAKSSMAWCTRCGKASFMRFEKRG